MSSPAGNDLPEKWRAEIHKMQSAGTPPQNDTSSSSVNAPLASQTTNNNKYPPILTPSKPFYPPRKKSDESDEETQNKNNHILSPKINDISKNSKITIKTDKPKNKKQNKKYNMANLRASHRRNSNTSITNYAHSSMSSLQKLN